MYCYMDMHGAFKSISILHPRKPIRSHHLKCVCPEHGCGLCSAMAAGVKCPQCLRFGLFVSLLGKQQFMQMQRFFLTALSFPDDAEKISNE